MRIRETLRVSKFLVVVILCLLFFTITLVTELGIFGRLKKPCLMRHLIECLFEHNSLHNDLNDVRGDEKLRKCCTVEPLVPVRRASQLAAPMRMEASPHLNGDVAYNQDCGEAQVEAHLATEHAAAGEAALTTM